MRAKLAVFLFVTTVFKCNGQLPILGDIISAARHRVHSTVEGVAGAVLGGFNLNLGGHLGFNKQQNPQHVPQKNPEETIVVVIEESNENDNYRPPNNNYRPEHHGHRPHRPHKPHHRPQPGYNDQNQGNYNQNEYDYQQNPHNQGNGNNNYGNNNQYTPPIDQNNNNNDEYNNNNNQFNQNDPNRPGEDQEHHNQNPYNNINNNGNTEQFYHNPATDSIKTTMSIEPSPMPNNDEKNKATDKPSDDLPLFVPLNPNEYVYGGDKINITAPKRETEKTKQAEAEDEDFPIDIRFKND